METLAVPAQIKELQQRMTKLGRRRIKFLKDLRETTDSLDKSHLIYDIQMLDCEINLIQESLDEFARGEKIKSEASDDDNNACIRCGEEIPKGRLEFLREAGKLRLCLNCYKKLYEGDAFLNRPSLKQVPFIQ